MVRCGAGQSPAMQIKLRGLDINLGIWFLSCPRFIRGQRGPSVCTHSASGMGGPRGATSPPGYTDSKEKADDFLNIVVNLYILKYFLSVLPGDHQGTTEEFLDMCCEPSQQMIALSQEATERRH